MKKNYSGNYFKIILSAGILLTALPIFIMAQQKQSNSGNIRLDTPGVSKPGDNIRKLKTGQNKHIIVNGNKNIDHMPIVSPDMKKYNMPVVSPSTGTKQFDTSKVRKRLKLQPSAPQ